MKVKAEGHPVKEALHGKNKFQCQQCPFTTTRGFNLRRHIARNHGLESVRAVEEGGCVCLECGHKCIFIKDLRNHLTRSHGFVFRTTCKEFTTLQGEVTICVTENSWDCQAFFVHF